MSLSLQTTPVRAQRQNELVDGGFSPAPYRTGEKLTYNVSFSNFPTAGHVELMVWGRGAYFGREGLELRARVETTGIVSAALYSLNNNYLAYVDPATGLPFRTQQVIREGSRSDDVSLDYNQPLGVSALPSKTTPFGASGTYDFLSAFYRLRALPLAPGAAYRVAVSNDGAQYDAVLQVTGRELIKTNVGSSNTIVTQLRVPGNKAINAYSIRVYFTDDARHVPVLMTLRLQAGEIRAELASAEILTEPAPGTTPDGNLPRNPSTNAPLVASSPSTVPGATNPGGDSASAATADLPFKVGEQLNFNFFLGNAAQAVGTASFQVRARDRFFNRDGFFLFGSMQSSGALQSLFPVNDRISSYVDASTLLPFRTELRLQEGKRNTNWVITNDQSSGTATFNDGTRLDVPIGAHDLLSVLYALRSFDLTPPKRSAVAMLINKRPRTLSITALRRETIELGGQRIPAVQLSLVTDDPQGDRFNLRLWVSADSRRLPLRLTAITPLGTVRADLSILPVGNQ